MKYLFTLGKSTLVGASIVFSLSSHAALTAVDLDGNATNGHDGVYDDVLNITWLADANLAASNTFGVTGIADSGRTGWSIAESFIAAMNADGGTGYLGVNTWRQPTVAPVNGSAFDTTYTNDGSSDIGFQLSAPVDGTYNPNGLSPGFTGSELAYHYYNNFDGIGRCSGVGIYCDNTQASNVYGIDDANNNDNLDLFINVQNSNYWTGTETAPGDASAFRFDAHNGNQDVSSKLADYYLWVVAPGNVAANAVPIPAAAWLFGSALAGLIGLRRFK